MVFNKIIPAFYWPTTIVLIDDDPVCLKNISRLFRKNRTVTFANPNEGLAFLNTNHTAVSDVDEFVFNPDESSELNNFTEIQSLHKKILKENRFDEIGLLVVDYDMPQRDGLSVIDALVTADIKNDMKKIFLTGKVTEKIAVQAFNDGKINRYVKKLEDNYDLLLRDYVELLQADYFIEKTANIIGRNSELKSILENPAMLRFFADFVEQENIIEFYLTDEHGGFLTINKDGSLRALIIQSSAVLDGIIQLVAGMKNLANAHAGVVALKNKTKMFSYFALNLIEQNPSLFDQYLIECKKIEGTDLFYALTDDISFLEIETDRVKKFSLKGSK